MQLPWCTQHTYIICTRCALHAGVYRLTTKATVVLSRWSHTQRCKCSPGLLGVTDKCTPECGIDVPHAGCDYLSMINYIRAKEYSSYHHAACMSQPARGTSIYVTSSHILHAGCDYLSMINYGQRNTVAIYHP